MITSVKSIDFLYKYIFNPLFFKILIVIMTLLTAIPYLQPIVGSYVKYGLAFGVLICIETLFNGKFIEIIKNKYNWPLWLFSIFYLITIFINRDTCFVKNISQLIYMVVFFYLFVGLTSILPKEQKIRELKIVLFLINLFVFIFSCIGIYAFLFGISKEYYVDVFNNSIQMGMADGRLWGLYQPNVGGSLAAISIFISIYFYLYINKIEKKWMRVVSYIALIFNIFIQFCYLVLTYSRGSTYAFIAAMAVYSFVKTYELFSKKRLVLRVVTALMVALVIAGSIYGLTGVTRNALEYVPGVFQKVIGYEKAVEEETVVITIPVINNTLSATNDAVVEEKNLEVEKIELDREETKNDLSMSGRTLIWETALDTLKGNYVFGLSLEKAIEKISENVFIGLKFSVTDGGLHNEYIAILVSSGIVGFVVLAIYMFICLFKNIVSIFSSKQYSNTNLVSLSIVLFFLISGLVEMRIMYRVGIFNVLFWICIGNIVPNSLGVKSK
ncbi:MAG: O-antigen ligase family protein [Oscillospiraceae bacterium]|nr:O-antigen ligase family protein [Oscillospiraceae bacterium]